MSISGFRVASLAAVAALGLLFSAQPAFAQATSSVSGTVRTMSGAPVGGASVDLRGVSTARTTTDARGAFHFDGVAPGIYEVVVTKAGFTEYIASIATTAGTTSTVDVSLTAASFTSLRTIAHAQTNALGVAHLNESTAAIDTIPSATFVNQGQTQVMHVLNEIPGIIVYQEQGANNGADQFAPQAIQIRGALPYETETLIDGHATPLSLSGTFDPSLLSPVMLQNVEIVKGPGSFPTEINYAIGGTVNFITLDPTLEPHAMIESGVDNWGGITTGFRATGSVGSNHFFQYAFAYATDGAPGPMQNYPLAGSGVFLVAGSPWYVNGQQLLSSPVGVGLAGPKAYNQYIQPVGLERYQEPFYVCCYPFNTDYDSKNELGKLKFNFSQSSSLTVSFLGGQDFGHTDNTGVAMSGAPIGNLGGSFSTFEPPAWYSGSVPAGTPIPFDLSSFLPGYGSTQQYLYQAEFRTTFGDWTALARYYDGGNTNFVYLNSPTSTALGFTGNTWGGGIFCPKGTSFTGAVCNPGGLAPVEESFDGQLATFIADNAVNYSVTNNHQRGESLDFERPLGNGNNLQLSVDRTGESGYELEVIPTSAVPEQYPFAPGSSLLFTTEALRYTFFAARNVQGEFGDYALQYSAHFTDNGGGITNGLPANWQNSTRAYNAPRLALTWQPNDNTSWRVAAGYSIAPPFLALVSSPGSTPTEIINGLPNLGFSESLNNGQIAPETALGIDLGLDHRIGRSGVVSIDAYDTTLRNMYLTSTMLVNQNYYPSSCSGAGYAVGQCPLYGSITNNLGHARYEGVEVSLGNAPARGFGFVVRGSLMRSYTYDLPQGFYCDNVPASECTPYHYDTNLGILPNENFQAAGLGFSAMGADPYSMGYGELNWRTENGSIYRIGVTYYGNNNAYDNPAFAVVSASIREQIGSRLALVLSADNLNGAYNQLWANQFGGVGTPLAPECVGKYGGPLYGAYGDTCTGLIALGAASRSAASVTSQLGPTGGENYGPTSFRLQLIQQFGSTNP
ncbi:MAG: TonB-dependent receptor domain-containing protein [Candidatus Tyrphobacter sp.]